ncbi:uncharacterized protein LOC113226478 [Hyposmocoma kahamanoa]|uniref:uncharacterized protein LOC113226478 n=1 Tax=Hyposmocoma kahamanoa TaxID=1477025 RepID=UPI000E6D81A5|nr:uncharacterized protein LOC113226478 [Hyposmocoma kahamanoa]
MSGKHNIDGGQAKEEEHVSSYTPIREAEPEFRSNLAKSKEKLSSDGAEEKLLQKEDEAKITTRVDMADAKYVVGDHRNGDAKIELDANKRQFSGLTKEELLKYADDPFWVRLRWFMFLLFWALWLLMLGCAIAIIVRAPKCAPPAAKSWYEYGLIADRSSSNDYSELSDELPALQNNNVEGMFITPCANTYDVLDENNSCIPDFKEFIEKAKKNSIKVIVDLTANFVSTSHKWFQLSVNRTGEFADYFVWNVSKDTDADTGRPKLPNKWNSVLGGEAWTWNGQRQQYYLHQYAVEQPDLNFHNDKVVGHFSHVIKIWMAAGASGVRLQKARQLVVNSTFAEEILSNNKDSGLKDYNFYWHTQTSDHPMLESLFGHWSHLVKTIGGDESVFTIAEDGVLKPEWFRLRENSSMLRPPSAIPRAVNANVTGLVADLNSLVNNHTWPILELVSEDPDATPELVKFAVLLPATPVFSTPLPGDDNDTLAVESFPHLVELRSDASLQHGERALDAVPASDGGGKLIACARWKAGHTGYVAVYNPGETAHANLTGMASLPDSLTIHHVSRQVHLVTNYTSNLSVKTGMVLVPAKSTVVLSYVPKTTAEQ